MMLSPSSDFRILRGTHSVLLPRLAYLAANRLSACFRFKLFLLGSAWDAGLLLEGPDSD